MDERDLHDLIGRVRSGGLSRRAFVRRMVAVGLTAPMAGMMLASRGVAMASDLRAGYTPTKAGGGGALRLLWWQAPTLINPHFAIGTKDQEACRIFYEPLAAWDAEGNLATVLAAEGARDGHVLVHRDPVSDLAARQHPPKFMAEWKPGPDATLRVQRNAVRRGVLRCRNHSPAGERPVVGEVVRGESSRLGFGDDQRMPVRGDHRAVREIEPVRGDLGLAVRRNTNQHATVG